MPIYIYHCNQCDIDEETRVAVEHRDDPRFHSCGHAMKRQYTPPAMTIKLTGNIMAQETLNSGASMPKRWYTDKAEKRAALGLEKPKKTVW